MRLWHPTLLGRACPPRPPNGRPVRFAACSLAACDIRFPLKLFADRLLHFLNTCLVWLNQLGCMQFDWSMLQGSIEYDRICSPLAPWRHPFGPGLSPVLRTPMATCRPFCNVSISLTVEPPLRQHPLMATCFMLTLGRIRAKRQLEGGNGPEHRIKTLYLCPLRLVRSQR